MENLTRDFTERKTYCPRCGNPNKIEYQFCNYCGIRLNEYPIEDCSSEQQSTHEITLQDMQSTHESTTQNQHSIHIIPEQKQLLNTQAVSRKCIIGLVAGVISLFYLPLLGQFPLLNAFKIIIFLMVGIMGIIISAISVREHYTISVIGLITSTLGTIIQMGSLWVLSLFY